MKIDYLNSDGIQASEKDALERMRQSFNASSFSEKWQGYAAFMMMHPTYRDREIDLVLLTHDRLLMIELKKWNGKITTMRDHWLLNNNDMGKSPVRMLADKWKILSSKIQSRLKPPAKQVWIDYRVILCGTADASSIPSDERPYVLTLDYFLKLSTRGAYQKEFKTLTSLPPVNATDHVIAFKEFFYGPEFKPTAFSFLNFQIDGEVIFPHPEGLYREYRAIKKDDVRHQAMLRRWDFSALQGKADTVDERARIALREHQVLGYIHEQNEEFDSVVLQPLSHPTRDDVDSDFCELYRLPLRQSRLTEFVNRFRTELKPIERLGLVKVLLSHFANLHDIGVAHRDIGDHSVWLERSSSKVAISGLITAYYPEAVTVGGLREQLRAGKFALPEDTAGVGQGTQSDPFRRDVYLLTVVCYYLLYLEWPPKDSGLHVWKFPSPEPFGSEIGNWLERGMELVPADRYCNAREMLNAVNSVHSDADKTWIDLKAFEPYRTSLLPMVVYRIEEDIRHGNSHMYTSTLNGDRVIVKIWYQIRPDIQRIKESHQLLSFLDKARQLKTQTSDLYPEIVDFGISDAGTYLVQKVVPGIPLTGVLDAQRSPKEALLLCRAVLYATEHLHRMGFEHGDLSPDNIFSEDGVIRFIDLIDMIPGGGEPLNPAYSPMGAEGVSCPERDCFAVAKICAHLLGPHVDNREYEISQVLEEIRICITRELNVYRVDRITAAVEALINPKLTQAPARIDVRLRRASIPTPIPSDNGFYYVGVFQDRKRSNVIHLTVSGVRSQLDISVDSDTLSVNRASLKDLQHSQFLQAANRSVTKFSAQIHILPSNLDGAQDLVQRLFAVPSVIEELDNLLGLHRPQAVTAVPGETPSTEEIWNAFILAEEAVLPEAEISGHLSWEAGKVSHLRIPYSKEGEPLDYEADEEIEVLREVNEDWVRIGYLNPRETDGNTLILDRADVRGKLEIGEKLKFRSVQDLSSFRRRRSAVLRIAAEESVIPNLLDYFDPDTCPEPTIFEDEPTDQQLDAYTVLDDDGQVVFSLNKQQRQAFIKLWSTGPVGLLQGPPGTGKTAFIASFIHFALTQGAKNILLASQSHEAVNNAAEKVVELCNRTGLAADLVRFGAEGMVSEPLRPYHASAILESYRELFRAEMRERVSTLSGNLGLPREFVEGWFDVDFYLTRLLGEAKRLSQQISMTPTSSVGLGPLKAKLNRRIERIAIISSQKFGVEPLADSAETVDFIKKELVDRFEVRSLDAIRRLDQVITVAKEWVERLGTQGGKFEEFLARARTLVCGTCVGLGHSNFGVVKNRYDWVIVDEAARATASELAVAVQSGRRILLVGDHRQLPPHYKREVIDNLALRLGCSDEAVLKRSDFERAFGSSYGDKVGRMLQTQYRMAPPIGDLVSSCFYPTPLLPGRGNPEPWYSLMPMFASAIVTWIDTSAAGAEATDRKDKGSTSTKNAFEAREVINVIRLITSKVDFMSALTSHSGEEEKPIGVICTYAEQKRLIQKLLSEQDWATGVRHLIKIDTVDSYQGKENRIIVLSLTRNNPWFKEGYLDEPERTNVALSRARDRLIIVGAAKMWKEHNLSSPLAKVYSYISQRIDGQQFQIVSAPVRGEQEN